MKIRTMKTATIHASAEKASVRKDSTANTGTAIIPAHAAQNAFKGQPATRMRAADYIFETLSRSILAGEITPGSVLATQRELALQFAVSPLVVRQATHRLEELGLVRVRQGSTTIVLDPNKASDVRLMELQLELATPGDRLALAAREQQALSTLPLLALAERRIQDEEIAELEALVDALPDNPSVQEALLFRVNFWGCVARATHNPVVAHQIRWWARVMQDLEHRAVTSIVKPARTDVAPRERYRRLLRAFRKRRGAVEAWHKVILELLDWTEAQPGHAIHKDKAKDKGAARGSQSRTRVAR
jgi:DNA-binding FadR family transcriptional regulator